LPLSGITSPANRESGMIYPTGERRNNHGGLTSNVDSPRPYIALSAKLHSTFSIPVGGLLMIDRMSDRQNDHGGVVPNTRAPGARITASTRLLRPAGRLLVIGDIAYHGSNSSYVARACHA
jgi:hypothetical protein